MTLTYAFEHFLEGSSFARRTRESYTEDLAPLLAEVGQKPLIALTPDVIQRFLASQESLFPATYNRRLAALRSFIRWLSRQGWVEDPALEGMQRKPEGKRAARALDLQKVELVLRTIEDPRDRALFWYSEVDLKRFSGHGSLRSLERYRASNREAAKRKAREWERREHT